MQIEDKRNEFRKYLETTGATDKLTAALVKLFQEKERPVDAVTYIRKCLCEECPDAEKMKELQKEVETLVKDKKKMDLELQVAKSQIKKSTSEANLALKQGFEALKADETENSNSLLKEYLTDEIFDKLKELKTGLGGTLWDNIQSGLTLFESEIGIFASDAKAYDTFALLFEPVLEDLHDVESDVNQPELDWGNPEELKDLDPPGHFIRSIRVTVGRAIDGVEFMPIIPLEKLQETTEKIRKVLVNITDDELKGTYTALEDLDETKRDLLIKDEILFGNPDDKFLKAAQTYRFWPIGRGFFANDKNNFRAWVNEEEHLQVISCNEGANLGEIYERLVKGMKCLEESNLQFARHTRWGFLAHNLRNIGNTLRVTAIANIPQLSLKENAEKLEALGEGHHITIKDRGNGIMELTSNKRVGMSEFDTVSAFQKGIQDIITAEKCSH